MGSPADFTRADHPLTLASFSKKRGRERFLQLNIEGPNDDLFFFFFITSKRQKVNCTLHSKQEITVCDQSPHKMSFSASSSPTGSRVTVKGTGDQRMSSIDQSLDVNTPPPRHGLSMHLYPSRQIYAPIHMHVCELTLLSPSLR